MSPSIKGLRALIIGLKGRVGNTMGFGLDLTVTTIYHSLALSSIWRS